MKISITAFFLYIFSATLYAQQYENDYLPPTPTVAALGKYVDAPVSMYTGTPEISVPIYEISCGKFKLPITLSYHAGGFRVEEQSSSIGHGWSLNATGVITRTIRHLLDNAPRHEFFDDYEGEMLEATGSPEDYQTLMDMSDNVNSRDGFPDMYMYNFNGYSGKFIYIAGEARMLPKKPIQIVKQQNGTGWIVKDEAGNTYYFTGVVETTVTKGGTSSNTEDISWYLSKIETPANDVILFEYKDTWHYQSISISETADYEISSIGNPTLKSTSTNSYNTTLYGKELWKIKFPQGEVEFMSEYDREDIVKPQGSSGALRLTRIKITDNAGTINKMFHLSHDYFRASGMDSPVNKRLKLLSVTEDLEPLSDSGVLGDSRVYKFEYNTGVSLPPKDSKAQDHWGYFNGRSNASLVPPLTREVECDVASGLDLAPTREPDRTKVIGDLLTRVYYPTGGYTEYEFESHDYGFVNDVPVPASQQKSNIVAYDVLVSAYTNHPEFDPATRTIHEEDFTVQNGQCAKIWINIIYPPEYDEGSQSQAKIELYSVEPELNFEFLLNRFDILDNGNNYIELGAGTYRIRAIGTMYGSIASAIVTYEDFDEVTVTKKYAGGARVKRIVQHDGVSPDIIRTFTYYNNGNPTKSSGVLIEEPSYFNYYHQFEPSQVDNDGSNLCPPSGSRQRLAITSHSQLPLGSGSHIGYREVQVSYGENGENGKSVYTFTTSFNYPNLTHGTDSDVSWRRGMMLTGTDYNNAGDTIKFAQNEYAIAGAQNYYGFKAESLGKHACAPNDQFSEGYPAYFKQSTSNHSSEWFYLKRTTTEEHDSESTKVFRNAEAFFYDNLLHLQPTRIVKEAANRKLVTYSAYPDDFADASGFIHDLRTSHIVHAPIERVTWQVDLDDLNPEILSGELFIYETGGRGLVQEIRQLEMAAAVPAGDFKFANRDLGVLPPDGTPGNFAPYTGYEPKLFYNYNGDFNPVQITPENGFPTSFIWGYKHEFPIAKIINASSEMVAYTGFENDNEGNWDAYTANSGDAHTGEKGYAGILTKSGLPAGSYIISLWVKDGTGTPVITGITPTEISEAVNGWRLYRWKASLSGDLVIDSNGSIIDDVKLYPSVGRMTTLTFAPLKGATSVTDPNDVTSYYNYDLTGRLKDVRDQYNNILKHFDYEYFLTN